MPLSLKPIKLLPLFSVIFCHTFFTACNGGRQTPDREGEVLVRIGDTELTRTELRHQLPASLPPEDSARQAKAYIRSWIDNRLLIDVAGKSLQNMEIIDRQTEDYRKELISRQYFSQYYSVQTAEGFKPDSVAAYYESNRDRFRLERPIVRGIYIKLPANYAHIKEIRQLIKSKKNEEIDRLEKIVYNAAVHYDYFRDRWVDVEQIELRVPFDASANPAQLLKTGSNIEIVQDNYVYLLNITDSKNAGETAPLDFAEDRVRQAMEFERRAILERNLKRDLLREAKNKGIIEIFCPL